MLLTVDLLSADLEAIKLATADILTLKYLNNMQ